MRERISPNKLPVARWVEIIEASHAAGLRSTATVMFGHIEEPWELAEHMRVVRELQERTGGITEFVPLSFIPFHTLLGRTHGVEEISREENLKHTAVFRLALGRTIPSLQASWVKMGLDVATESLSWGVNDLGGTLMEESISRLAGSYHGVRLDPPQLIAAAHARRPPGRRAHDALRRAPVLAGGRRGRLTMRHGLYVAPFGELADVRTLAAVAARGRGERLGRHLRLGPRHDLRRPRSGRPVDRADRRRAGHRAPAPGGDGHAAGAPAPVGRRAPGRRPRPPVRRAAWSSAPASAATAGAS